MAEVVTVPVKSPVLSKTNITGALLALFGVLGLLNILPTELSSPTAVEAIVAAGGTLVVAFRTLARSVLRRDA